MAEDEKKGAKEKKNAKEGNGILACFTFSIESSPSTLLSKYPSCGESTIFAMPKMYLTIEKWNQWYVNTNFDFPLFGNAKYNVNQKSQCHNKIKPKYLCIFLGLFVCKIYNIFSHSG